MHLKKRVAFEVLFKEYREISVFSDQPVTGELIPPPAIILSWCGTQIMLSPAFSIAGI